jgi:hypothetical protein
MRTIVTRLTADEVDMIQIALGFWIADFEGVADGEQLTLAADIAERLCGELAADGHCRTKP